MTMPTYSQLNHNAAFWERPSEPEDQRRQAPEGDRTSRGLNQQSDSFAWPQTSYAVPTRQSQDGWVHSHGMAEPPAVAAHPLANPSLTPQHNLASHATSLANNGVIQDTFDSQKQNQRSLSQSEDTAPRKRAKRNPDPQRTARRPAPPRKSKQTKDFTTLVSHMDDDEIIALIQQRASDIPDHVPIFMQEFSSKQTALDHLLRLGATISFLPPPPDVAINLHDLDPNTRPSLQQLIFEAVAEAPNVEATPSWIQGEADIRSFVDKNAYQHAIVLKQIADPADSSACICLLVQCLFDLHDKDKGIPIHDLDLRGQPIEEVLAQVYDVDKLCTKKSKYPLDLSLSLFQRVTLLIDIVEKYKWVAKDVLTNTNILEMVVSPWRYLATKLNNVSSAKTRQERWDDDQVRRGVKVVEQNKNTTAEVTEDVATQIQETQPPAEFQEPDLPHLSRSNAADQYDESRAGPPSEDLSAVLNYTFDTRPGGDRGDWSFDNTRLKDQSFGWSPN